MKKRFALALLPLSVILLRPLAFVSHVWAQPPGGSSANEHRVSSLSQPGQMSQPVATPTKPALFWCMYTLNAGTAHATHYVNDNLLYTASTKNQEVTDAWMAYIRKTYSISPLQERANSSTGCNDVSTDSPRGSQWFVDQTEAKWKAAGHTVTHLNWTYKPQPLPAMGATGASAAAQTSAGTYMYCTSDVGTSPVYSSEIFAVELPAGQHSSHNPQQVVFDRITADFLTFIRNKYSYKNNSNYPAGCPTFGAGAAALASAQDGKKKLEEQARASSLQVVESGWTYNPNASSAAASAPAPAAAAQPAGASASAAPVTHPSASARAAHAATPPPAAASTAAAAAPALAASAAGKAYRCAFNVHEAGGAVRYSAGPIVTEASQPALSEAWRHYINATYHPSHQQGNAGCMILPGKPGNWERAVSAFEANSNHLGVQTMHVNWTSAPKQ